jgi:hypothetical protein
VHRAFNAGVRVKPDESPGAAPRKRTSWVAWLALAALAGIVVAIWIPARSDYRQRTQVMKALHGMLELRDALAQNFAQDGKWPESLRDMPAARAGQYTREVVIARGAGGSDEIELAITMRSDGVDPRVAGKSIRLLSQDGGRSWQCRTGTAAERDLPQACRTQP